MKIKTTLTDFLYDKKYFITLFDNFIHVFQFKNLLKLSKEIIILQLENFKLIVEGDNLCIKQMTNDEILIEGNIKELKKEYE